MKTKFLIKDKARQLFNELGLMNVTLRNVAEQLQKSYGNITYHYATKEVLITELFDDMNTELSALQHPSPIENLLEYFLQLPNDSYEITLKYLFFTLDLNEIKRNYPNFFTRVNELNKTRKTKWFSLLKILVEKGFIKSDLEQEDLYYLMFLSASVRTTYFQFTDTVDYKKRVFVDTVNRLLNPYLTNKGKKIYHQSNLK